MPDRFRVGVTADFRTQTYEALAPALARELEKMDWEFMPDTGAVVPAEVADRYDAIMALGVAFPASSFAGLERLALIARWGVGYDRIDVDAATAADVMLAITPESVRRPVAEGIITFVFALAKSLPTLERLCRSGRWRANLPQSWTIEGKVFGSIGAGNIGREALRMARGVGFGRLLAHDPFPGALPEGVELVDLDRLLRESDFVSVSCPLNEQTRRLIGARELALMKPTAYLINTARGPIVDQCALYEALRERRIAGAALDVFEVEPIPLDDPLLGLDNLIATPHAICWTEELFSEQVYYTCRNLRVVAGGSAPEHVVNRAVIERPGMRSKLERWRNK